MKKNYYFRLTPKRIAFTLPMKRLSSCNESPLLFILIAFHFFIGFSMKESIGRHRCDKRKQNIIIMTTCVILNLLFE